MAFSEDEVAILMNLLKIPAEKQNFEEFRHQIQNLIEKNDNLEKYYLSKNDNTLEKILNNPGLQHLAEFIFDNLKYKDLEICRGINQSSKQILDYQMEKPMFLLRKFQGLSKKNEKDWIKVIESVRNSEKDKAISAYLQWNLKKSPKKVDLPCYSNPIVQDDFRMIIDEFVLTDNCYLVTLPNNWKPYACKAPGCTKRYNDPSSLRKHVKTVHAHEFYASKRHKGNNYDTPKGDSMDGSHPYTTPRTPHS